MCTHIFACVRAHPKAAHNELEKNRRANLRSYLDQIKAILPPEYDSARDTTLSLLTRARNHLRILGHRRNEMLCRRNDIVTENAKLKERIEKAKAMRNAKRCRKQEEQHQHQQQQNIISQEEFTPTVTPMITDNSRNGSPIFLEYSPSTKPQQLFIPSPTDRMVTIDPYLEGLLPPVPLSYPYLHQMQANRAAMV
uniref:BHLH domain-containing protein n=1 Tax=Panagrolaimus sp. ES5 TaxID=591445 RepID=A0AC34GWM9_9BILA